MNNRLHRTTLLVLYQASVALGIVMLPVALFVHRIGGVSIPVHRVIEELGEAYERTQPA